VGGASRRAERGRGCSSVVYTDISIMNICIERKTYGDGGGGGGRGDLLLRTHVLRNISSMTHLSIEE